MQRRSAEAFALPGEIEPSRPLERDGFSRALTHGSRNFGRPSFTSCPCGPLVSYTRRDDAPCSRAISRTGTRTPCRPSTNVLGELGKAVEYSDMSALPPPV